MGWNGMRVDVTNGVLKQEEIDAYIKRAEKKYPNARISSMKIKVDGDFVDIKYEAEPIPFDRIRRITGYLVGTMDNWNDAKRSEELDRIKHTVWK